MDIDQIKCVLAVVHHKTFLEAAMSLNRSQSSLSKEIKKLELELGTPLFTRTTRKVYLTPAGRDFIGYGKQILDIHEEILRSVTKHLHADKRQLRIGSIYFGQNNPLAPAIAHFIHLHPSMDIEVKDSTTTPLLKDLRSNELDIVFVSSMYADVLKKETFSSSQDLQAFSCFCHSYYVVVSRSHPFSGRETLSFSDLNGQAFIFTGESMDVYHQTLRALFEYYHVNVHSSICCSSVRSVLHMVSQNLGIAVLTRLVIEPSEDLVIIPLKGGLVRDTQMLMKKGPQPAYVSDFWNYIKSEFS